LLNGNGNRLSMPLPRSRSPVKTSLNSPAQRNKLLVRGTPPSHGSQPSSGGTKRRLVSNNAKSSGPRSFSQPIFGKGIPRLSAGTRSSRAFTNGHHSQPLRQESDDDEGPNWDAEDGDDHDVGAFVDESMAMLAAETDVSPDTEPLEDEGGSSAEENTAQTAASRRKPGPKLSHRGGGRPPRVAKPVKGHIVEEERSSDAAEQEPQEPPEDDTSGSSEPEEVVPKPRGKVGKQKAQKPVPDVRSKKRRSLTEIEEEEDNEATGTRQTKRQRTESAPMTAPKGRGRPPKKAAVPRDEDAEQIEVPKATTSKAPPAEKGKRGRKRKSSILPGDTSHVAIPRGPPLPKSRGLLINRREVPGDSNSSIVQTRSGRNSFKPLAYWRNERVGYDPDEAMTDAFASRGKKFILPSVKEVVRVDEPESNLPSRKGSKRSANGGKSRSRRGKRRASYDSDDDGAPADPWEVDPGTMEGHVVCWQPEHEFNPPALDELVDVEEKQLAISGAAVETQTVKDATFCYAKTLSEGFFNCGVVDLPPGSEKRPKNSRKMFMSFFVHTGRVLVTVNETSFRISKGGMWFVPRGKQFPFKVICCGIGSCILTVFIGNYYSIENDYDQPARIFFSQGCEVAPRPTEEDEDGNE